MKSLYPTWEFTSLQVFFTTKWALEVKFFSYLAAEQSSIQPLHVDAGPLLHGAVGGDGGQEEEELHQDSFHFGAQQEFPVFVDVEQNVLLVKIISLTYFSVYG